MQRSLTRLATLVAALLLVLPNVAAAQGSGVTFDDGPSSKEYAVPLDAARGQTRKKTPARKSATSAPATTTATTTTPGSTGSNEKQDEKKPKTETTTRTRTQPETVLVKPPDPPASAAAAVTPVRSQDSSSDGLGAGVIIAGLAVAAIVLGVLGGLVIRRRRTPIDEF